MLASQSLDKRPEKRRRTKLVSRRHATRPRLGGNQRKSSFVKRPNGYFFIMHMIRSTPSIHPSIDLPLVALIIKASSATWNAYNHLLSLHNPPRISPESFQIQSKICINRFKIANKSYRKPNRIPNAPQNRFFAIFCNFWTPQSLPKSTQNC